MPTFGYLSIGSGSLSLIDTDLWGSYSLARTLLLGNPVPAGNMVSAHVYMQGPTSGVQAVVQIGVYDATLGVPANYPLVASSTTFIVPVSAPFQWWVTPISGLLTAGSSYCAAVLAFGPGFRGRIASDPVPSEPCFRPFIAPGVLPDPLGITTNGTHLWSLYITYNLLPGETDFVHCCNDN